jgi:CubicO group peptidase (beta-lactamase class C family)
VESVYQAASLTKPVVAFAALQLAIAGELNLNASVAHYLPNGYTHFQGVLARRPGDPSNALPSSLLAQIPLITLLNHTSGLPNWSTKPMSPSFAPSTRWQYSGEAFMLLQSVIEAVAGQDFEKFMRTHVLQPIGMKSSSMVWMPAFDSSAQVGQAGVLSPRPVRFLHAAAAASLYTTANDYGRFMAALFANGSVLTLTLKQPASVDEQLRISWGLGWGIEQTEKGPLLWQWGNNPGFRSFAMLSPDSGDGFVLFTSSEHGMPLAVPLAHQVFPTEHNAFRFGMVG